MALMPKAKGRLTWLATTSLDLGRNLACFEMSYQEWLLNTRLVPDRVIGSERFPFSRDRTVNNQIPSAETSARTFSIEGLSGSHFKDKFESSLFIHGCSKQISR